MTLEEAAVTFVRENRLLTAGDFVWCAVSAGADSVSMLHFLYHHRRALGIEIGVAHVHHGIPEARSDEAEQTTRALARSLGLRYRLLRTDVPGLMARRGLSIESAGRLVRYRWFRRLLQQDPRCRIATAHTADDLAETVLLRLLRGSGAAGVSGIRPGLRLEPSATRFQVVRPFLKVRRQQTRAYQEKHGLPIVEDPTNQDTSLPRNRVRGILLPLLEERFNPRVVSALCRFAQSMREDAEYLETEAARALQTMIEHEEFGSLRLRTEVSALATPLASRVWRQALQRLGTPATRGEHVQRLHRLAQGPPGRQSPLPGGGWARREYDSIALWSRHQPLPLPPTNAVTLAIPGEVQFGGWQIRTGLSTPDQAAVWRLDADRVRAAGPLMVRSRRQGDRWVPPGKSSKRKLKSALNAWRVPPSQRDYIPLLVAGEELVAVLGYAVDERFSVTEKTSQVLVVELST